MKNCLIELQHVTKRYKGYESEVVALDDISLRIFAGEFVAITGLSGSGKSTLLHCMGLLDRPTEGLHPKMMCGRHIIDMTLG